MTTSFQQRQIIARCMNEKGFDYWFKAWWDMSAADRGVAQYPIGTPGFEAEFGSAPADSPYDWETAGCHGYAVHVMGLDNAN